ncbi:MAG: sulfatase [Phycisphaeraceae bacterium]
MRVALAFGLAHLALLLMIQCQNFFACLLPQDGRIDAALGFLADLPFLQTQNLLAALTVGAVAYLAAGHRAGRALLLVGHLGMSFYLLLDQIYYRLFADHFRISVTECVRAFNPLLGISSLWHEMDALFVVNFVLVLAVLAALARPMLSSSPPADRPPRQATPQIILALAGLLILAGLPGAFADEHHNLQDHPLSTLIGDALTPPLDMVLSDPAHAADTRLPSRPDELPDPQGDASVQPELPRAAAAITNTHKQPNVVLVILESVGSLQLLDQDGKPQPQLAPNLARLAEQSVIFPQLYTVFPATVRTHVALNTGGPHPTLSSLYELLRRPYQDPLLAEHFADAGYRSALFSGQRLDGEAMDQFIARAGYDHVYDYATDPANQDPETQIHSWGATEEHTLAQIRTWLDEVADADQPFFMMYMNAATHHPYASPENYPSPFPDDEPLDRYHGSIHYSDNAIGDLLATLEKRGLRENTIIAVVGDHGQAFGKRHATNHTHKYHLYEENVRSFLMLSHPALNDATVSPRIGMVGDLLPTLAAAAGLDQPAAPGQNLLASRLAPRRVFFHKNAYPEQWGLRDGRWKFIANIRDGKPQLYDLADDPAEQHNLASQDPQRVAAYHELCRQWLQQTDADYTARLGPPPPEPPGLLP